MTDSQIIAIAIVFVAAIGSIMFNNSRITDLRDHMNHGLDNMNRRFDDMNHRFDAVNQRIEDKFNLVTERLQRIEDNITTS